MHHLLNQLIVYRNLTRDPLLSTFGEIFQNFEAGETPADVLNSALNENVHRLLDVATQYGFDQNLWQNYLAFCIATTENPFSLLCEQRDAQQGSVNILVKQDLTAIKAMFDYDFSILEKALNTNLFSLLTDYKALTKNHQFYNQLVSEKIRTLSQSLARAQDPADLLCVVTTFYRDNGAGMIGLNHGFRLSGSGSDLRLEPITNLFSSSLDDLIGYEKQKKALIANTEDFLQGLRANNLLLYGDSGTGKSTCIKAILNKYAARGLRVIEINKYQLQDLPLIINQIKRRNYYFIIFMDDLSFEEFETDFKYLKAVIEGGLELTPPNILVYATSNRRHLIKETWSDRNDRQGQNDLHHSDTVEEKISLVNRFGITLNFPRPSRQEYLKIVQGLAKRHPAITLSVEELSQKALECANWHGNYSGRRAQQFINSILGK